MLQRAASNAYSWWWASHIRTKQSKWLEQSLQDMEEKVQYMLKMIEEDGDSFAKRAEMYFKNRPEMINFVEESYRAFRALAERYDHLSTELQNANNTLASVFPDQVPYDLDDDDNEFSLPKMPKNINIMPPQVPAPNVPKIPKLPKNRNKDLKGLLTTASKKLQAKKWKMDNNPNHVVPKSGLTKEEAVEEIDKLQKDILAMQTVKEFMKSSYESGLAKYWEIENQIMEMQQRVCILQDEFSVGKAIEDDEARTLMAEAALKSCQETLAQLQEKQEKSTQEAREEYKRIEDARQKIKSLKHEFLPDQVDEEKDEFDKAKGKKGKTQESLDHLETKIKENLDGEFKKPLTVTQLAETIDQLVNKVINLESSVSSQTALIDRLRTETDDLQAQIRNLEGDKVTLIDGTHTLSKRLKEMEEKLHGVQDLNQNVENQNTNLQTHFTETRCSLDHLSEKLRNVKPDDELEVKSPVVEAISSKSCTSKMGEQAEKSSVVAAKSSNSSTSKTEEQGKNGSVVGAKSSNSSTLKTGEQGERDAKSSNSSTSKTEEEGEREAKTSNSSTSKTEEQGEKKSVVEAKSSNSSILKTGEVVKKNDGDSSKLSGDSQSEVKETDKKKISGTKDSSALKSEESREATKGEKKEDLNWQQMLLSGLEDREKILLTEYTTILKNYKEVKKKLSEEETKNQGSLVEMTVQVRELRNAVAKRDHEIQSLREKLRLLQDIVGEDNKDMKVDNLSTREDLVVPSAEKEEDIKVISIDQPQPVSVIEEKLRMDIDAILDENLDFWLRFSTAFHQVQKFKTEVEDLQAEIAKLKEKTTDGKSSTSMFTTDVKSDVRPIYKHLREIQNELTVWLEQSASLKDEMQRRLSSLGNIQEEITMALKEGMEEEEITFSSHQAAKFQGEILNMQQENNKVNEELQAGLDHVTALQLETEKTLAKLEEEFGLSESKNQNGAQLGRSPSRNRIPLHNFIFGVKPKKQRASIFACMHHHRKLAQAKGGFSL